jgi:aminotransferase
MTIVKIMMLARQRGAVDLAVGSPGFPEPAAAALAAACEAIRGGQNQYEMPAGNMALREVVAAPAGADPVTEVTVTVGATEALSAGLQAVVGPGDEVVVFEPFFETYNRAIRLAGGVPRPVRLAVPAWRWDPAELTAAFGRRVRAVIVNSPANPTGRVLDADELAHLAALCGQWDVTCFSDEVYAEFVYDGRVHVSPRELMPERTVVLGSVSKSHALSGWRIGWAIAPPAITASIRAVHEAATIGTAAPLQRAVAEMLANISPDWSDRLRTTMQAERDQLVEALRDAGFTCDPPEGACYVLAGIDKLTTATATEFALDLIETAGIAVLPSTGFFSRPEEGEALVRVAFNKSPAVLAEGRRRLTSVHRISPTEVEPREPE